MLCTAPERGPGVCTMSVTAAGLADAGWQGEGCAARGWPVGDSRWPLPGDEDVPRQHSVVQLQAGAQWLRYDERNGVLL